MTELVSPSSFFANPARTPSLAFWLRALLGIERGPTVPGSRVAIDADQYTPSGAGFRPAEQPASGQITLPRIASRRVRSQSGLYRSVTAERERSQCHTERHLWTNHERPAHYRHGSQSRHAWRIIQLALKFLFYGSVLASPGQLRETISMSPVRLRTSTATACSWRRSPKSTHASPIFKLRMRTWGRASGRAVCER